MLRLAGLCRRAAERDAGTIRWSSIGGAVTFVNPEPLAPFADVIAAGEGEVLVPALMPAIRERPDRARAADAPGTERGFYIPSFYDVRYAADGTIAAFEPRARHRRAGGR